MALIHTGIENPGDAIAVAQRLSETHALGFNMASEPKVGALLAALAASKPGGRFLELGTGNGARHRVDPDGHGSSISPRYGRYGS